MLLTGRSNLANTFQFADQRERSRITKPKKKNHVVTLFIRCIEDVFCFGACNLRCPRESVWLHSFDHSQIGATHQARLGHEAGC